MINEMRRREMLRLSNEAAQKLSRECLETALFKLMGQKPFDQIAIGEVAALAGVSRNAFYRKYKTKEALLEGLSETITAKLKDALPDYETADTAGYTRFFRIIFENADAFRILLAVRSSLADRLMGGEKSYLQIAWEGALAQMTIRWFETGMKETPGYMGVLCDHLLSRLQTGTLENSINA